MYVEEALFKLLTEDAGVSPLIGTRIYPGDLTETTTYPAIAVRTETDTPEPVLDSRVVGVPQKNFDFYVCSKGPRNDAQAYRQLRRVVEAMRLCLQGYSGVVGDALSPESFVTIQGIFRDVENDIPYDDKTGTHRSIARYNVRYVETHPAA